MAQYFTPGVYAEKQSPTQMAGLATGVPAFLGYAGGEPGSTPITSWSQFQDKFSTGQVSYMPFAVRGFFENGGHLCYVITLGKSGDPGDPVDALKDGLNRAEVEEVDLICAPDVLRPQKPGNGPLQPPNPVPSQVLAMQAAVLNHCERMNDRFAILDSPPGLKPEEVVPQLKLSSTNGALYYPWIQVFDPLAQASLFVPPCGHVAGVYAATDARVHVFKAPANVALEGVQDLETNVTNAQQEILNPAGVNCLRAFPGRGIRVWGARTLSPVSEWQYVNVRRLVLTTVRWVERNMADKVLEPNGPQLWARILRDLSVYLDGLFRQGALKGNSTEEAYYVKCDADTNPPEVRESGAVVADIGLALSSPSEFVVVRILQTASGTTLGPTQTG